MIWSYSQLYEGCLVGGSYSTMVKLQHKRRNTVFPKTAYKFRVADYLVWNEAQERHSGHSQIQLFLNLTSSSNFHRLPCVLSQLSLEMGEAFLLSPQTEFSSCAGHSLDSFQLAWGVHTSRFVSSLRFQQGVPELPLVLKVEVLCGQKELCRDVAPDVGHCEILSSLLEARGEILFHRKSHVSRESSKHKSMDDVSLVTDHISFFALNVRKLSPECMVHLQYRVPSFAFLKYLNSWTNFPHFVSFLLVSFILGNIELKFCKPS